MLIYMNASETQCNNMGMRFGYNEKWYLGMKPLEITEEELKEKFESFKACEVEENLYLVLFEDNCGSCLVPCEIANFDGYIKANGVKYSVSNVVDLLDIEFEDKEKDLIIEEVSVNNNIVQRILNKYIGENLLDLTDYLTYLYDLMPIEADDEEILRTLLLANPGIDYYEEEKLWIANCEKEQLLYDLVLESEVCDSNVIEYMDTEAFVMNELGIERIITNGKFTIMMK